MATINTDQKIAVDYVIDCLKNKTRCSLFIQGVAGTGKSFVINEIEKIVSKKNKNFIKASHQSIAAINIDGVTIYKLFSFSGIDRRKSRIMIDNGLQIIFEKNKEGKYIRQKQYKISEYNETITFTVNELNNWLIIDEISTVSAEMLDDMDNVLREIFVKEEFFGGINFIFLGHMSQLKPVKETPIYNVPKTHPINFVKIIELTINQRQKNNEFFELCNGVMKSCLTKEQKKLLKSRNIKNFDKEVYKDMVHIYPTNYICNKHNLQKMLELQDTFYFIKSIDKGERKNLNDSDKKMFKGLSNFIILSENAKVMTTRNVYDNENINYVNGEMFSVDSIIHGKEITKEEFFKDNFSKEIEDIDLSEFFQLPKNRLKFCYASEVEIVLKKTNIINEESKTEKDTDIYKTLKIQDENLTTVMKSEKKLVEKIIFTRSMFPIQLSWAVTTHKILGITLDYAVIDMSRKNFDPVQLYVNISRVKDINNLYIKSLDLPLSISEDKKVIKEFINGIQENNTNNLPIPKEKNILDEFF